MLQKYRLTRVDAVQLATATDRLGQETVNILWEEMSQRMGFDPSTVAILKNRYFYAEPKLLLIGNETTDGPLK